MKPYVIFFVSVWLIMNSCSSTQVTSSWQAENITPKQYKHIVVIGILAQKDRSLRDLIEHYFVDELKKLGYNAESALDVYGPKAFAKMEESQIVDKLKNTGADAVLTVVLLDKSKEENFVPGNVFYTPIGTYYNYFGRYYVTVFDRVATPGYYNSYTKYFWESNLYDVGNNELLYSVQTKSFDPSSSETLAYENSRVIIKDMLNKRVLTKKYR